MSGQSSDSPAGAPPGTRFPRELDPHAERERLQAVSVARADVFESTREAAAGVERDLLTHEHRLELVRRVAVEQKVPVEVLLDLTARARSGVAVNELLDAVLDHAVELFAAERGAILVPSDSGRLLSVLVSSPPRSTRPDFRLLNGQGVAGHVFADGVPVFAADTRAQAWYEPGPRAADWPHALVCVPLEVAGERLGVLCLERATGDWVALQAQEALLSFAHHAAAQWQSLRTYDELHSRVAELSVLCEISRELSGSLEREALLQKIVERACDLLHCGKASLMLFDDDKQTLSIRHARGLAPELIGTVKIRPGEGVSGWVAEHGEPVLIEDITADERFAPRARDGQGSGRYTTCSLLSVPLLIGTEVVGVLNVNNKDDNAIFSRRDCDNLCLLASQAAVSVENARLYETLQRLAVTDPLTKLFRRNYFEEQMDAELSRCRRYGRPLSVMMLDIDHFKRVNDTYGHQAGDQVLLGLAGLLRRYGRKDDVIARYGGEEFVALLVETDAAGAQLAGERVRAAVLGHTFDVGGAEPLKLTISVGHASFPTGAADASELVKCADLALYGAKHGGRNQVKGYTEGLEMPEGGVASERHE